MSGEAERAAAARAEDDAMLSWPFCPFAADGMCPGDPPCPSALERACTGWGEDE